jgi:hypothetical protein
MTLSTEKKNPSKRDQALNDATNDATSGQFGEEPLDIPEDQLRNSER